MKRVPQLCLFVSTALLALAPTPAVGDEMVATAAPVPTPTPAPTLAAMPRPMPPKPAKKILVALDAGHGGSKVGAVRGKLIEKEITAAAVQALKVRLLAQGYRVMETRPGDTDVGLRDRVAAANEAGADLFISIHCNAMPYGRSARRV